MQTARIDNVYHFQDFLGKGSYGSVVLAFKRDGQPAQIREDRKEGLDRDFDPYFSKVAIKIIQKSHIIKDNNGLRSLLNEFRMHWALDQCENILRLLQIYEDQGNVYLVLEYQPNGTLLTMIEDNQ